MYTMMNIQRTPVGKGLITHITDVSTLSSVYTHVYCQAALTNKTFTTHITGIGLDITMPELTSFQSLQIME